MANLLCILETKYCVCDESGSNISGPQGHAARISAADDDSALSSAEKRRDNASRPTSCESVEKERAKWAEGMQTGHGSQAASRGAQDRERYNACIAAQVCYT